MFDIYISKWILVCGRVLRKLFGYVLKLIKFVIVLVIGDFIGVILY